MTNVLECYLIILKNNEELLNRRIQDLRIKDMNLKQKEYLLNKVKEMKFEVKEEVISATYIKEQEEKEKEKEKELLLLQAKAKAEIVLSVQPNVEFFLQRIIIFLNIFFFSYY
jgi:hypothetical protein